MNDRKICGLLLIAIVVCLLVVQSAGPVYAQPNLPPQNAQAQPDSTPLNPLKYLASSWPADVTLKEKGHLLEICPDNTCDGFVSSANVPAAELRDFAYLYIYYFSDYVDLPAWRSNAEAKNAAGRVLSKPEYRNCKNQSDLESARCVLLDLSRGGKIKLIFVRYDENQRNVVPEDIHKELSKKPSSAQ
jgi:hypothetical protein